MPAVYQDHGIRFLFPENWRLDQTRHRSGVTISVQSPGTGFWSITLQNRRIEPQRAADAALSALREEYPVLDSEEVEGSVGSRSAVGYDVNFISLDLTNTTWIRAFRGPNCTALVMYQSADLELEAMEPVFRAISTALEFGEPAAPEPPTP
ncbi:MAG: hypothetical protein ACOC46_04825 [Pirellulales bacterium]